MSPEQIRGEKSPTHKADLYTLGCVMFEMITGRVPFTAQTTAEVLYQHMEDVPPRVSTIVLDCPVWLDTLVAQMLEKSPSARPHDAAAIIRQLEEIKQRVAEGASVVGHATQGGPTSLRTSQDVAGAKQLVTRKRRRRRSDSNQPFYERAWFLAACLVLVGCAVAWAMWPKSEEWYLRHAAALLATDGNGGEWEQARMLYLEPWEKRFPDGEHADKRREFVDRIDMAQAEKQAEFRALRAREPKTEGERLYMNARQYEQFGDRVTALEQYRAMLALISDDGDDRPYVNLAKRQVRSIEAAGDSPDARLQTIQEALEKADKLEAEGRTLQARKIWESIESLYRGNKELEPLVERALSRLGKEGATAERSNRSAPEAPPSE
jgi:tetratricopeptide (TPR) repeat protein